jgi:hypothetical protein
MLTEWQIYRMFEGRKGAWSTFQFLIRERLLAPERRWLPTARLAVRRCGERGERAGGRAALVRRPHGRERRSSKSGRAGSAAPDPAPALDTASVPRELALAQLQPRNARRPRARLRGGEEELLAAVAEPERPADAAGEEERPGCARRARRSPSSRAAARAPAGSVRLGEREDRLGVDGHLGSARSKPCSSISSSSLKMIPLWTPTTAPWRIGWLLASIAGWPFV